MPAIGNNHNITLTLSIRLSADGFCFFVSNPQDNSLIKAKRFVAKEGESLSDLLLRELGQPEFYNRNIDQVFVLTSAPSTRVPIEEFRREEAQTLYELVFNIPDIEKLHVGYNILPRLEAVELYSIPRDVEDTILQFYPTARFFGTNSMLLERLLHLEEEEEESTYQRLYLCFLPEQICLFKFEGGKLAFANGYQTSSIENMVYLILYAWKTLGLNAETDHLVFITNEASGSSMSNSTRLSTRLTNFLAHIDSITPSMLFPRVPMAHEKELPFDLLALLLNRL